MVSVVPGLQARVPSAMGEMVTVATGEVRRVLVAMEVAAVGAAGLVTGTPVAVAVALAEEVGEAVVAVAGQVAALVLSVLTTLRLLMVGLLGKTPPMAVMAPSFWHFPCQMRPALIMCRLNRHGHGYPSSMDTYDAGNKASFILNKILVKGSLLVVCYNYQQSRGLAG